MAVIDTFRNVWSRKVQKAMVTQLRNLQEVAHSLPRRSRCTPGVVEDRSGCGARGLSKNLSYDSVKCNLWLGTEKALAFSHSREPWCTPCKRCAYRMCDMSHPLGTPNAHTRHRAYASHSAPLHPCDASPLSYRRYARPRAGHVGGRISLQTPHVLLL